MKAFIFLTYISCLENINNLIQVLIDWISTAATQTVSFLTNIGGIFCGHKQLIGGYHLHGQKVCLLWLEHVSETCCITFSAGFWFGFSAGIDFTQGHSVSLRILHNFETHKPTVELLGTKLGFSSKWICNKMQNKNETFHLVDNQMDWV